MHNAALRFVVLVDDLNLAAWQKQALCEALGSQAATLVGVVVNASSPSTSAPRWRKRWSDRRLALWRVYSRFFVEPSCVATRRSEAKELNNVPVFHESPISVGRFGQAFSSEALAFIKEMRPDFILRFGFGILKGEVLRCCTFGVWSYHHGDHLKFRGQPPGFWEVYKSFPVTGAMLQVLSEELDAGIILQKGYFPTTRHSYPRTRDDVLLGSTSFLRKACVQIARSRSLPRKNTSQEIKGPVYREPTNREMLSFLTTVAVCFIRNQIRYRLFKQSWNIAVVPAPIHVVAGLEGADKQRIAIAKASWMKGRPRRFAADPFGYESPDKSHLRILFEDFDWQANKGLIAYTDFSQSGFGPPTTLLEAKTHLSYPSVIQEGSQHFFIPEHSEARDVSAFAIDMTGKCLSKKTIFSHVEFVDTTFFHWKGRYWCFALKDAAVRNTELHVFYGGSQLLGSEWRAHPLNPVVVDVRSARPAGTLFTQGGKLYRPSQDCSTHYGSAVTLNEVTTLSEEDYLEQAVARLEPLDGSSYPDGLHTLSAVGDLTLIDGAKNIPVWRS